LKLSKSMRIWNVIYPVAIYFVVTAVTLFVLDFILPADLNSKLLRQLIIRINSIFIFVLLSGSDDAWKSRGKSAVLETV